MKQSLKYEATMEQQEEVDINYEDSFIVMQVSR